MEGTGSFTIEEYYLWRKKYDVLKNMYPWQREYLNVQYMETEKIRVKKLSEWHGKFLKTNENEYVKDETSLYIIPVDISSSWKSSIAELGDYNYFGLSAFQNSTDLLMIGLIPFDEKRQLQDYKLIRIIKSRRINIFNSRLKSGLAVILIDEWEYLPSDTIYIDVPFERKIVGNLFQEYLTSDKMITTSFQAPIISAPHGFNSIGGIALASMASDSTYSKLLIKAIQHMLPPEYRDVKPPILVYKGHQFDYDRGIKFHLAERPYSDNNHLSSFNDNDYKHLTYEISRRNNYAGEYSIFSTLGVGFGNLTQIWKELMLNFTATEITMPQRLDDFPAADIEFSRLNNAVSEDLWIQIVYARQLKPSFTRDVNNDFIKKVKQVYFDFDAILTDVYKQDTERDYLIRTMMPSMQSNIERLSQSFARSNDRNEVHASDLKDTRNLIVDNFSGFVESDKFRYLKTALEKKKTNIRYSIIQTTLINTPKLTITELYDVVKSENQFRNIHDLQKFLDWLTEKNFVIHDGNKRYTWIGK